MKTLSLIPALGLSLFAATALHAEDVMVVYDASGSMWGQIDGTSKIEIARDVMGDLLDSWPDNTNLGLVAYGHRQGGDCADFETVVPIGPVDRSDFRQVVDGINPLGRTPLSAAVQHAAEELSWRDAPATVILISDGIENCQADPCALSAQLAEQGVAFTTHVIGFDLATDEHPHLACIAQNTGGMFLPAQDAAELAAAVQQVGAAIAETASQPEPVTDPEPEPEPEPEAELPTASISGPETAVAGSSFPISWSDPIHPRDWVTIVPLGADEGAYTVFHRVGANSERGIIAPAEPGLYELRYMLNEGPVTLARAPIEITGAEASITGPETVRAGDTLRFSWSDPVHPRDWVTIVPAGADEGAYTVFHRGGANTRRDITAPHEPGLYELRYVLNEGGITLGRHIIEVVDATASLDDGASLSAPETAAPGETVIVTWTGGSDGADQRIALAREDQALFAWISAQAIDPEGALSFTLPDEPGLYEFRYLDISNQAVLGRTITDTR